MVLIWLALLGLGLIVSVILPSEPQTLGGSTVLLAAIAWAIAGGLLIRSHTRELALLAFVLEAGVGLNYAGGLEARAAFPNYSSLALLALMCAVLLWIPYRLTLTPFRRARHDGAVTPEVFARLAKGLIPTLFLPFNAFLSLSLPTAVLFWVIPDSVLIQKGILRLAPLAVIFLACAQAIVLRGVRRFVHAHPGFARAYALIPVSERSLGLWGGGLAAAGCLAEIWRGNWMLWIGSAVYLVLVVHTLAPLWVQNPFAPSRPVPPPSIAAAEPAVSLPSAFRYALWLMPLGAIYLVVLATTLAVTRP